MKFIVDECTGSRVAKWLRGEGHDVFSVYDEARGLSDDGVIKIAWDEQRILVTNDKDFGEKVFRDRRPHVGVILMRLEDERSAVKIHGHTDNLVPRMTGFPTMTSGSSTMRSSSWASVI